MTVTLFMPVLNEIDGLRALLPKIDRASFNQILMVDGGSRDGSLQFAQAQGIETYVQQKRGIRHAYIEAWPLIRSESVITFSPDGNCPVEALPLLTTSLKTGSDMVIGSRYLGSAKSEDDDLLTGFGNWMFTSVINLFHGGRYTDAMGIFRAYKADLFYRLDLHKEESYAPERWCGTVIGIEPLLSIRCAKRGMSVCEIPVGEPARIGGDRKLQVVRWGSAYMLQTIRELYFWK